MPLSAVGTRGVMIKLSTERHFKVRVHQIDCGALLSKDIVPYASCTAADRTLQEASVPLKA